MPTKRSFDIKTKLDLVNYAKQNSVEGASRKFNVLASSIRKWRKQEDQIGYFKNDSEGRDLLKIKRKRSRNCKLRKMKTQPSITKS